MFIQIKRLLSLSFKLQNKNTLLGFLLSILPPLIPALSIEFFIGRLIDPLNEFVGLRMINFLFFYFFSQSLISTISSIPKFSNALKRTYLNIKSIVFVEILLIMIPTTLLLLLSCFLFHFELIKILGIVLNFFFFLFFTYIIAHYISVLNLIFHDFSRIISFIFQILFWITPIIYSSSALKYPVLKILVLINPVTFFMLINEIIFMQSYEPSNIIISLSSSFAFLGLIAFLLKKLRNDFQMFL